MKNLNLEVAIPEEVDQVLNVLRAIRGITKKAIITEALEHYVQCVGGETTNVLRRQQTSLRDSPRGTQG